MMRAMLAEFVAGAVRGLIVKYQLTAPVAVLR